MKKTIIAAIIASGLSFQAYAQSSLNLVGDEEMKTSSSKVIKKSKNTAKVDAKTALVTSDITVGANSKNFFQIGNPASQDEDIVDGGGKSISLLLLLQQLTPNGWVVAKLDDVSVKQKVNWRGGASWYQILKDVAHKNKFDVLVNWNNKTISIAKDGVIKNMKNTEFNNGEDKNVFEMEQTSMTHSAMNTSVSPMKKTLTPSFSEPKKTIESQKQEMQKPVAPVIKSWSIQGDLTLRENIEKLAKENGFTVVWNSKDYQEVDRTIEASPVFDAEDGVIQQLAVDYGPESNVEVKLAFEFWNNKTLVVKDWKAK